MKFCISDRSAASFLRLALAARIASGIIIDLPGLLNAGWISILIGGLLSVPPLWAAVQCRRAKAPVPTLLLPVFLPLFLFDSASIADLIADSASYMALNSIFAAYLLLPLVLLCLACLRLNGDALGSSASLWNRILPWFGLIVILIQFRDYQPDWLMPVLGPGVREILNGAFKAAGWLTLPAALYLITPCESEEHSLRPLQTALIASGCAALVALIFSMMTPSIPDTTLYTRAFRLNTLLANGRTSLALQIPSIALWYVGLFYALLFDVFVSALLLQRCLPRWSRYACVLCALTAVVILTASGLAERSMTLRAAGWFYIITSGAVAANMILHLLRKGESQRA